VGEIVVGYLVSSTFDFKIYKFYLASDGIYEIRVFKHSKVDPISCFQWNVGN